MLNALNIGILGKINSNKMLLQFNRKYDSKSSYWETKVKDLREYLQNKYRI